MKHILHFLTRRKRIDLTARAYRLHNRRKSDADRYLKIHAILSKGRNS